MSSQSFSRSPRVFVVAPLPPPYGGMSLQAEKLISNLLHQGLSVASIATNPAPPRGLRWVERLPVLRTLLRTAQYLFLLSGKLPEADVVHHFSASGLYFFLQSVPVLLLGRGLNKRVVVNYRGGNAPHFFRRWHWCVVPLLHLADCIAVPSEFLQQVFRRYGVEATRLPNIADTELFTWRLRQRFAPRLLVTRHLEPMYNLRCLLRAFRLIKARFPEAVLTVAGNGSEERQLKELARQWELSDVAFLGAVAYRDLPALYAQHDIYVNSSLIDNFPGALLEAACSGLAIITTRAGGIPQMIRDGETGILVDLDDHEALAAGVITVVENASLGQGLACRARDWAQQFSWSKVWPFLLECYRVERTPKVTVVSRGQDSGLPICGETSDHELVR